MLEARVAHADGFIVIELTYGMILRCIVCAEFTFDAIRLVWRDVNGVPRAASTVVTTGKHGELDVTLGTIRLITAQVNEGPML